MDSTDNSKISWRIISKYLGILLYPLAVSLLLPIGIAAYENDWLAVQGFALSLAVSLVTSWYLQKGVPESRILKGEGLAIISLSFPIASLIGALPYYWCLPVSFLDAYFDAMSGFSTTGLSVLDPLHFPTSLLFWHAEMQWLGGMGFVVLFLGVLTQGNSNLALLVPADASKLRERISLSELARRTLWIYLIMTAVQSALLLACGMPLLDAVCYTFATVSTGGFASHRESVAAFDGPWIPTIISLFMILGAVQFSLYIQLVWFSANWKERALAVFKNNQLRMLLALVLTGLVFGFLIGTEPTSYTSFAFTALSAQSTTGFDYHSQLGQNPTASMLLLPPMFIGGSLVSTAGGIKLIRFLAVLLLLKKLTAAPYRKQRQVEKKTDVEILSQPGERRTAVLLIIMQVLLLFLSTAFFVGAGFDPLNSLFEVTSALGTVGLSTGIVTASLSSGLKSLIILLMWMGRVEVFPVFMLIYTIKRKF